LWPETVRRSTSFSGPLGLRSSARGLNDAGLVVREHDADELCLRTNGREQGRGFDDTLRRAWQESYVDLLLRKGLGGTEDGVVLDAGGDEVDWADDMLEGSEECEVVAFGAAGGEDDLGGAAVEEMGEGVAGVVDGGAGELALLVDGAGVAVVL
jgi:hypothetical protein